MKFELKTGNEKHSKLFSNFLGIFFIVALIISLCDIALKLGIISRNYQFEYNCKLLSIEKSRTNFKNISKLSGLKNKQQIWEFCRDFVK